MSHPDEETQKCPRCGSEHVARTGYTLAVALVMLLWFGIYIMIFVDPLAGMAMIALAVVLILRMADPDKKKTRCRRCGHAWFNTKPRAGDNDNPGP